MRLSTRQRGYFDALGVLICEVVLLATLLKAGSAARDRRPCAFRKVASGDKPAAVVTSWLRLLGTAVFGLVAAQHRGATGLRR